MNLVLFGSSGNVVLNDLRVSITFWLTLCKHVWTLPKKLRSYTCYSFQLSNKLWTQADSAYLKLVTFRLCIIFFLWTVIVVSVISFVLIMAERSIINVGSLQKFEGITIYNSDVKLFVVLKQRNSENKVKPAGEDGKSLETQKSFTLCVHIRLHGVNSR